LTVKAILLRRILAASVCTVLAIAGGLALAQAKPFSNATTVDDITVTARPITSFDRGDSHRRRFGKLTWRGGLVLNSRSPHFGGWSGLAVDADGKRILAVSDAGTWMRADIVYDGDQPVGLAAARIGPLRTRAGEALSRDRDRDAEAVALVNGTLMDGELLIAFERNHRIGRFAIGPDGVAPPARYLSLPAAAKKMRSNKGVEAVSVLRGGPYKGSLVAFPERLRSRAGNPVGWLWVKGRPQEVEIATGGDYDVTDIEPLSDGSLLVLERRYRRDEGVKARLRLIRQDELRPGARMRGEVLLDATMAQEIDNMEGLAAHKDASGKIVVTLISDDNFNRFLQRTVLLQFSLDGVDLASAGAQH